jgi:hypothetical protein
MTRGFHLAQINVGRIVAPIGDPLMAEFVAQLDAINALADASPGFVWRLQWPFGNPADICPLGDPLLLVNMSVWESIETLHAYVYRSAHTRVMRDRKKWFKKFDGPYYALWWIEQGHVPTVDEGYARIRLLAERGPSVDAFWFGEGYPAPDAPAEPAASQKTSGP